MRRRGTCPSPTSGTLRGNGGSCRNSGGSSARDFRGPCRPVSSWRKSPCGRCPRGPEGEGKSLFEEREASFLAVEQEFETLKQQRREKERELEEERDKVERAKAKLMSIKTNKEYYAMLKEIEGTRRTNAAREEELLSILVRYEDC